MANQAHQAVLVQALQAPFVPSRLTRIVGQLSVGLIYYERVHVLLERPEDLSEILAFFIRCGEFEAFFKLVDEGTIVFHNPTFMIPAMSQGEWLFDLDYLRIQVVRPSTAPQVHITGNFRDRILYSPPVARAIGRGSRFRRLSRLSALVNVDVEPKQFLSAAAATNADFFSKDRATMLLRLSLLRQSEQLQPFINELSVTDIDRLTLPDGKAGRKLQVHIGGSLEAAVVRLGCKLPEQAGELSFVGNAYFQMAFAAHHGVDLWPERTTAGVIDLKLDELVASTGVSQIVDVLQESVEFPDIAQLVESGKLSAADVLKLRRMSSRFREWLQTQADRDGDAIIAYHSEVARESGLWTLGRNAIRIFGVVGGAAGGAALSNQVGTSGVTGAAVGAAIGEAGSKAIEFGADMLAKMGAGWRPLVFGQRYRNLVVKLAEK